MTIFQHKKGLVFATAFLLAVFLFFSPEILLADTTAVLRPISDGTNDSASWTNAAGTACDAADCSLEVKESSGTFCTNSDGNASFVASNTNGAQQTFNLDISSIPANSTITQISITGCARKQSAAQADNTFQTRRCVNASCVSSGTNITAGGTYAESTQSHTGLSISKAAATTIEIGAEVTGSVTNNVRLSQISAVITYTPPPPPSPTPTPSPTPAPTPSPTPTPSAGSNVAPTSVIISGQAYPGGKIEFLRKSIQDEIYRSIPEATSTVFLDGTFRIQLSALLQGEYLFALRAEDKDGRKTGVIAFNTDLASSDHLEAKDIFVPPTIDFSKSIIALGHDVNLKGYAAPERKIEIEIDGILKGETRSDKNGFWAYATSTAPFRIGDHYARARQIDVGGRSGSEEPSGSKRKASQFSVSRTFRISLLAFPKADFNSDDKITVSDWSIFLYRWGSENKDLKAKIDMNEDGKIDISDFSIFLKAMQI